MTYSCWFLYICTLFSVRVLLRTSSRFVYFCGLFTGFVNRHGLFCIFSCSCIVSDSSKMNQGQRMNERQMKDAFAHRFNSVGRLQDIQTIQVVQTMVVDGERRKEVILGRKFQNTMTRIINLVAFQRMCERTLERHMRKNYMNSCLTITYFSL